MAQYPATCTHQDPLLCYPCQHQNSASEQCSHTSQWLRHLRMDYLGQCGGVEQQRLCTQSSPIHVLWFGGSIWDLHGPEFFQQYNQLHPLNLSQPQKIHIFVTIAASFNDFKQIPSANTKEMLFAMTTLSLWRFRLSLKQCHS